jgi:hypothetical protein
MQSKINDFIIIQIGTEFVVCDNLVSALRLKYALKNYNLKIIKENHRQVFSLIPKIGPGLRLGQIITGMVLYTQGLVELDL